MTRVYGMRDRQHLGADVSTSEAIYTGRKINVLIEKNIENVHQTVKSISNKAGDCSAAD